MFLFSKKVTPTEITTKIGKERKKGREERY
jgi:hypothetical protein